MECHRKLAVLVTTRLWNLRNSRKFSKVLQHNNGQWYGLSAERVKATVLHLYLQVTQERSWPNQTIPVLLLSPCPVPQRRGSLFSSTARPILPAPSISVPEPVKEAVISSKRRELPRGLFPQPPPKPTSKSVEILFQSGLHNPAVGQNPRKFWMYVVIQIISAFSFGGNVSYICAVVLWAFFYTRGGH